MRGVLLLLGMLAALSQAAAGEALTVAAAASVYRPLEEIAALYQTSARRHVQLVSGSTGKLYAQILQGAPYDVFLAADRRRPRLLEEQGLALAGSRFVYAEGRLVLWTLRGDLGLRERGLSALTDARIRRIALANPDAAPFGAAALTALKQARLDELLGARLVYGESVAQAFLFVRSGNADVGLLPVSSVYQQGGVSVALPHAEAVVMEAVVLKRAPAEAVDFAQFLRSQQARSVWQRYGLGVGQ